MTYTEKLKNPKWQKRRLEILDRDNWECQLCGDKETEFHVHHKIYNKEPWDALDEHLTSYCKHCHFIIEAFIKAGIEYELVKVNKYADSNKVDKIMVCFLKKEPDYFSIFFIKFNSTENDITDIINMSPVVIRETNADLDKIKAALKITKNG